MGGVFMALSFGRGNRHVKSSVFVNSKERFLLGSFGANISQKTCLPMKI